MLFMLAFVVLVLNLYLRPSQPDHLRASRVPHHTMLFLFFYGLCHYIPICRLKEFFAPIQPGHLLRER